MTGILIEKAAAYGEIHLEIRLKGKTFREVAHVSVSNNQPTTNLQFKPYIIVPSNADVRLTAIADGASTYIGGSIDGVLAIVE